MWFLRGKPTAINFQAIVVSQPGGYQLTKYRFQVACDPETLKDGKVWLSIAFPWSPHKKDGSFEIVDASEYSQHFTVGENVQVLGLDDITIVEKPRVLKTSPDIQLMNVQEMCHWFLDDFGFATMWLTSTANATESGTASHAETSSGSASSGSASSGSASQWYELNYRHKIDAESVLFFPTRLPAVVAGSHIPVSGSLVAINAERTEIPKWLEFQSRKGNVDFYKYGEWDWSADTILHTSNWDSSDDEFDSDSETD